MEHVNDYNLAITAAAGTCTTTIEKEGRFKKDTVDIQLRQAIITSSSNLSRLECTGPRKNAFVREVTWRACARQVPKAELDRSESSWTVLRINFAFADHDL